jgi:hypothetical protein
MKKSGNKKSKKMENAIAITATLAQPRLLTNLVEKLADRRYDLGYSNEKVQLGWQADETSSIEAHVSGDIHFSVNDETVNMPFVSSFLFTCTKGKGQDYRLAWISSLS